MLDSVLVTNNDPFMEFMNSGRDDDELERQIAEERKEIDDRKKKYFEGKSVQEDTA